MKPQSIRQVGDAAASTRARVVIVGAGFGGLECARKLNRAAVDVLLNAARHDLLTESAS